MWEAFDRNLDPMSPPPIAGKSNARTALTVEVKGAAAANHVREQAERDCFAPFPAFMKPWHQVQYVIVIIIACHQSSAVLVPFMIRAEIERELFTQTE